ncbi:hypothetical protein, partial [Mycolicibacterium monacense]|uniref:hypothetical protein n=1 Tax=Mycolicibacterium monacense TaxID=85693 RepID=UPI000AAC5913
PLFFFKPKTAYDICAWLVGSEMCIRDSDNHNHHDDAADHDDDAADDHTADHDPADDHTAAGDHDDAAAGDHDVRDSAVRADPHPDPGAQQLT